MARFATFVDAMRGRHAQRMVDPPSPKPWICTIRKLPAGARYRHMFGAIAHYVAQNALRAHCSDESPETTGNIMSYYHARPSMAQSKSSAEPLHHRHERRCFRFLLT